MKIFSSILNKIGSGKWAFRSLLAVLLLTCGINNAMALGTCSYPSSTGKLTINKEMTARADLPVGATIGSYSNSQQFKLANYCDGEYRQIPRVGVNHPSINDYTYASGIEGVGIRITINSGMVTTFITSQTIPGDGVTPLYVERVEVEFIKTGEITPGVLPTGDLVTIQMQDNAGIRKAFTVDIGNVIVKQPSCYITGNSAIPVAMGTAKKEDFKGINSTLTPVDVQIPLQCSAFTAVNISFDAISTHGNGIIDLAKGSAEGVGIQLKMNNKAVEFNKKSLVTETTEQGRFTIPLTAAYIQTEEVITGGTANAVANFTVTYE
jgi:type 1 fimbria pilin